MRFRKIRRVKLSLRKKLFIVLLLVSVLPVLLVTLLSMYTMNSTLYNQIIENGESSSGTIQERLSFVVKDYSATFYDFEINSQFKDNIWVWCNENELNFSRQWELISALNATISADSTINSIDLYNLCNGQVLTAKRTGAKLLSDDSGYDAWGSRNPDIQTNTALERNDNEMLIKHQMNSFDTGKALVVVVMHVRYSAIEHQLANTMSSDTNSLYVFNDENEMVLSIEGRIDEGFQNEIAERLDVVKELRSTQMPIEIDGQYVFAKSVADGKLFLVQTIPEDIITAAATQTIQTGVLVGGLSIVVVMIVSIILSRIISNPIVELSETMKTLSVSDFSAVSNIDREDEIGLLQKSFHGMIARNQELINKEYISKLEKNHAQLYALQAQINPHFLYNTLQTIGGMALNNQVSSIYSMTVSLSDIMRYSLDFSKEMVPIREELRYLEGYLFIQNQRFLNRLRVDIDIDEELKEFLIPKLILQPIIENSLEHGMKDKTGVWNLEISAKLTPQNDILFKITDNGIGVLEEKLHKIQSELADVDKVWKSSKHIGLKNVNTRIRLTYQGNYSVRIYSQKGCGTTVEFLIKAVKEAENEI